MVRKCMQGWYWIIGDEVSDDCYPTKEAAEAAELFIDDELSEMMNPCDGL